jgi:NOL1/NOP2/fmu family ribosome biogenesis protein
MGSALWNKELDFNEAAHDFFTSAYGSEGILCMDYLAKLSELFQPEYLSREIPAVNARASIKFAEIKNVIKSFRPAIERNLKLKEQNRAKSWEYLSEHALICYSFSEILEAAALGKRDTVFEKWEMLKTALQNKEDILSKVFDVYLFISYIGYELKEILNTD